MDKESNEVLKTPDKCGFAKCAIRALYRKNLKLDKAANQENPSD
jgi:hypothetical protein